MKWCTRLALRHRAPLCVRVGYFRRWMCSADRQAITIVEQRALPRSLWPTLLHGDGVAVPQTRCSGRLLAPWRGRGPLAGSTRGALVDLPDRLADFV
jgi:hypothetical protein